MLQSVPKSIDSHTTFIPNETVNYSQHKRPLLLDRIGSEEGVVGNAVKLSI